MSKCVINVSKIKNAINLNYPDLFQFRRRSGTTRKKCYIRNVNIQFRQSKYAINLKSLYIKHKIMFLFLF